MISAKIIKDSINPSKNRITTFILTYPRYIHAQILTHRAFSRNSSSSRAIPTNRVIKEVYENPAYPIHWGKNQAGMQAYSEHDKKRQFLGKIIWKSASLFAIGSAWILNKLGFHKQIVNRILEPFSHITVLVTATNYSNFIALRAEDSAQPEIAELAMKMNEELRRSSPKKLLEDQWHLPFVDSTEGTMENLINSAAMSARVSYNNFMGKVPTFEENKKLYDKLVSANPKHLSPTEHQAKAFATGQKSGNFTGFQQFRKTFQDECL